ncbi:MAG: CusA/CzcA family heavy metal efflux RND transporter [Terrimicrobiaceae bacterium]|nr:CusA/CzcA family heavy metal efflux RND transporter [Terrimicrobiaceae bacterium]
MNDKGAIGWLIDWALRNRFLIACGTLILISTGIWAVRNTPVDAIPDLSENQVIVFADWTGRSPQEVEDQVTYPLSTNLQGLAGVREVRALSMFGFSLLTVIFHDDVDNYFARTRVLERLGFLQGLMPEGVVPQLGPDATGLGWVYQYYFDVAPDAGQDLGSLRSLQDYFVRYQLAAVDGVAEVASIGGFVRQYQVAVSPEKMRAAGVGIREVLEALSDNNLNVGGKVIEENGMEFVLRGVGLVRSLDDLRKIAVRSSAGVPVYVEDIAEVKIGGDFRRGALDVDGREAVGGIVVMRTGENAMAVIERVKEKIAAISPSLPNGVTIKAFYDRSGLIDRTIDTLRHALIEEILLVTLAHIIFLWHFRSILIVTIPLPVSILISFILMKVTGVTSNIMSLSGIAIAIGVLVDAGIVMTENVIRHCEAEENRLGRRLSAAETWATTRAAAHQVGRPIFLAMAIIILAFLPVFALSGQEGKLFHPLAFTKTFAMIGATLLGVTLVPVLCTWLVRGPFHAERENFVMHRLTELYRPALHWALGHGRTVLGLAAILLAVAAVLAFGLPKSITAPLDRTAPALSGWLPRGLGSEFMPPLNEGSLLFMPVLIPSASLESIHEIMSWQDRVIRSVPEVASVAGKLGRAETATDPAPIEMIETTIMLKPESEWREGISKEDLIAELSEKLTTVPGYVPGFLQPIENRILMLSTGIRAQLGIKILGDNLDVLQNVAYEIERLVRSVPGAVGVAASRTLAKPYLEIHPDRQALARFGLSIREIMEVVEAGLGGVTTGVSIEGRQRIPIQVRLERSSRDDMERLGALLIPTSQGHSVPLGQVAEIRRTSGPSEIASEDGLLRVFVQANVIDRDLGGFVEEVRGRVESEITLPPGVTIRWSGQYENQLRAQRTLSFILPLVLVIIFMLLYIVFHSAAEAAHVLLAVPFALTGGVFLQWALGYPFSVAVWIGYIALFGTAIQTGVVMVVYLEHMVAERRKALGDAFGPADLLSAVIDGAMLRLRPKVMTVATVIASLLPIMWSTKAGSEIMKPLATPVIGGMISSLLHILVVTPVIYYWLQRQRMKAE